MKKIIIRGISKTSVFGKVSLDLKEKPDLCPVFTKPFSKQTEFWKWLIILLFTLTPVFFSACIGFNVYSFDEYTGYYKNNSSYNVYIQEFYFSDYDSSKNKIYNDSGIFIEKNKTITGAPTHAYVYLDKLLFIDTDTHKLIRSISAAEYFKILELNDVNVQTTKEGDEKTYYTYYFYITDEFLEY